MGAKKNDQVWESIIWSVVLGLITLGTCYMFFIEKNTKGFMGILTILLLVVIAVGQKKFRNLLPSAFVSIVYGFIFMAVGLGTFAGGYKIPHFDDLLHVFSGVWLAYGSWIILQKSVGDVLAQQLSKPFIAFYMICFSLAAAGAWELLEFAGDKLFHFTAQGRDADDTMFDMIDGLVGGTITAFLITKQRNAKK